MFSRYKYKICEKCGKRHKNMLGMSARITENKWCCIWCIPCQIVYQKINFWTSGNEKIDNFIQERQLNFDISTNTVFEWMPYNQFSDVKEINNCGFFTKYIAKWKCGPIYCDRLNLKYSRQSDTQVILKCLHNSQNIIDEV